MKIYCTRDMPRLRYIAEIILGEILGLAWDVTSDKRKLGKCPVINYSEENITGSLKIKPVSLLFETGVRNHEILVSRWKGFPVFFTSQDEPDLPFDIFAASFYLVTRYEEYIEFEPDTYGRFKASSSIAYKNGFLEIPVIDLWCREFSKVLLKKFQTLTFKRNEFRALLTIDTDQPFESPGKSLLDSIGGLLMNFKNKTGTIGEHHRSIARSERDPWEVFDYIFKNIEMNGSDARFFFPVGDHSRYDKNPSWKNDKYRSLINRIAVKYKTGLHSSFNAAINYSMICNELSRLKTILSGEVVSNRFHYIRLLFPDSFRDIIKAGITDEYSMGYPDEAGFRAGIARPFYFYDILEDHPTGLRIYPFQVMDSALFQDKKTDSAQSMDLIQRLISETRKAGGLFVSIWHNSLLAESDAMPGRREVFEFMLKNQGPPVV